jgi:hypothetical protein
MGNSNEIHNMLAAEAMSARGHVTRRKNVLHQPAVWSSVSSAGAFLYKLCFFVSELSSRCFFLRRGGKNHFIPHYLIQASSRALANE